MSRRGVRRGLVLGLAGLLMLASVIGGLVTWKNRSDADDVPLGANRAAAMLAAKTIATAFFTLDPENVDRQVDDVLGDATGGFLEEYTAQRDAVIANVKDKKRQVTAQVPTGGTAIATFSSSKAVVLVAINVNSRESTRVAVANQYRLRLTMERTGQRWKAATLDQLAGVAGPGSYRPGPLSGGNTAVLEAATDGVAAALGYDYRALDTSLTDAIAFLTPGFGTDFAQTFTSTVRPLAEQKKAVTKAYVRATGLVSRDGDAARCLVFVDQVLDPATTASISEARVFVDLKRINGTWLIDNLTRA